MRKGRQAAVADSPPNAEQTPYKPRSVPPSCRPRAKRHSVQLLRALLDASRTKTPPPQQEQATQGTQAVSSQAVAQEPHQGDDDGNKDKPCETRQVITASPSTALAEAHAVPSLGVRCTPLCPLPPPLPSSSEHARSPPSDSPSPPQAQQAGQAPQQPHPPVQPPLKSTPLGKEDAPCATPPSPMLQCCPAALLAQCDRKEEVHAAVEEEEEEEAVMMTATTNTQAALHTVAHLMPLCPARTAPTVMRESMNENYCSYYNNNNSSSNNDVNYMPLDAIGTDTMASASCGVAGRPLVLERLHSPVRTSTPSPLITLLPVANASGETTPEREALVAQSATNHHGLAAHGRRLFLTCSLPSRVGRCLPRPSSPMSRAPPAEPQGVRETHLTCNSPPPAAPAARRAASDEVKLSCTPVVAPLHTPTVPAATTHSPAQRLVTWQKALPAASSSSSSSSSFSSHSSSFYSSVSSLASTVSSAALAATRPQHEEQLPRTSHEYAPAAAQGHTRAHEDSGSHSHRSHTTEMYKRASITESADGLTYLNDYAIFGDIGHGASATVKLAHSFSRYKNVAIKVISRQPQGRRRRRLLRCSSAYVGSATPAPSESEDSDDAKESNVSDHNNNKEEGEEEDTAWPRKRRGGPHARHSPRALTDMLASPRPPPRHPTTFFTASQQSEINIMTKLHHRNIVPLYEVIDDPRSNKLYLIMKYIEKGAIATVHEDGTLSARYSEAQLTSIAAQVCDGLVYLHTHGIVHRDIKPENILLSAKGRAYLSDFGVSELLHPSHHRPHAGTDHQRNDGGLDADESAALQALDVCKYQGTPLFMAPELYVRRDDLEQLASPLRVAAAAKTDNNNSTTAKEEENKGKGKEEGEQTETPAAAESYQISLFALDIWALGVTFLALLTGRVPFTSLAQVRACALEEDKVIALIPASLSHAWAELLRAMLAPDPRRRARARAVRDALYRILHHGQPTAGATKGREKKKQKAVTLVVTTPPERTSEAAAATTITTAESPVKRGRDAVQPVLMSPHSASPGCAARPPRAERPPQPRRFMRASLPTSPSSASRHKREAEHDPPPQTSSTTTATTTTTTLKTMMMMTTSRRSWQRLRATSSAEVQSGCPTPRRYTPVTLLRSLGLAESPRRPWCTPVRSAVAVAPHHRSPTKSARVSDPPRHSPHAAALRTPAQRQCASMPLSATSGEAYTMTGQRAKTPRPGLLLPSLMMPRNTPSLPTKEPLLPSSTTFSSSHSDMKESSTVSTHEPNWPRSGRGQADKIAHLRDALRVPIV